ncbi:MAG: DUF2244 domain-containing protein [Pseudomonadota bacterium]
MPYQWSETSPPARLRLWPHRSMTNAGFAWFMGATFALVCLPLVAVVGSPVMWALLPFVIGAVGLTMFAIRWKDREMTMSEELTIGETTVALVRREVRGPDRRWEANPHWVQVALHKAGGPVENYVTLKGGDREVEIGAFLSPDERAALYDDLSRRLPARP